MKLQEGKWTSSQYALQGFSCAGKSTTIIEGRAIDPAFLHWKALNLLFTPKCQSSGSIALLVKLNDDSLAPGLCEGLLSDCCHSIINILFYSIYSLTA